MFQSFVIGPAGVGRFGLIRRCVECRDRAGNAGATCAGFGSGCMVDRALAEEETCQALTFASLPPAPAQFGAP